MQYRKFGRTGWNVSDIGYGLWGMSGWSGSDDQQSAGALQHAADAGCNFFDSAWGYGEGKSDQFLGQLLAANPGHADCMPRRKSRRKISSGRRILLTPTMTFFLPIMFSSTPTQFAPSSAPTPSTCCNSTSGKTHGLTSLDFRNTVEKLKRDGIIRAFGLSLNRWEP